MRAKLRKSLIVTGAVAFVAVALAGLPGSVVLASDLCPNEELRAVNNSLALPECRAYELVTPDMSQARIGVLVGKNDLNNAMDTWFVSPIGESVIFDSSGSLQGENSNGSADRYESLRTPQGWRTKFQGPSGADVGAGVFVGGSTPDHLFGFYAVAKGSKGPTAAGSYLRERNGALIPVAQGSLGVDYGAEAVWTTAGGEHVIFTKSPKSIETPVRLESNSARLPFTAIYDRPVGGPTTVLSLLPGDVTPDAGARYAATSPDGRAVAFEVNGTLYLRRSGQTTDIAAYPEVGRTLSCEWLNASGSSSIRWLRDGAVIAGATGNTYTSEPADEGRSVQCELEAADRTAAISTPPTIIGSPGPLGSPPVLTDSPAAPTPQNPQAGDVETCGSGAWTDNPTLTFQWYRNGTLLPAATGPTYEVQAADVPGNLQCKVLATTTAGSNSAMSAATPTNPAPSESAVLPAIEVAGSLKRAQSARSSAFGVASVSNGGSRVFYATGDSHQQAEDPYESFDVFDSTTDQKHVIASSGKIWPVNISPDGSHAYFVSTAVLAGNTNSFGEGGNPSAYNLYEWSSSQGVTYIAPVAFSDIATGSGGFLGLGGLISSSNPLDGGPGPSVNPSRTNSSGSIFLFQGSEDIDPDYESQGHSEVFRYDATDESLICISCNPNGVPATAPAELAASPSAAGDLPNSGFSHIPNMNPDGSVIVFETREDLLPQDHNGKYDVYSWRGGELSLISSGSYPEHSFLFGMSEDAEDIVFQTFQTLTVQDRDGGNRSLYDARVGGGFLPPAAPPICNGEGCLPPLSASPSLLAPSTLTVYGAGNVKPRSKHKRPKPRRRGRGNHRNQARMGGTAK